MGLLTGVGHIILRFTQNCGETSHKNFPSVEFIRTARTTASAKLDAAACRKQIVPQLLAAL
jgi:hypothetical protein